MARTFPHTPERGALAILLGVLLVALFAMIALAIDLVVYASSVSQARNYANLAALAALEEYIATDGAHSDKLAAALARANKVASMNLVLSTQQGGAAAQTLSTTSTDQVVLQPGYWYFALQRNNVNPCVNSESPPCFVSYEQSRGNANAFRIHGSFYQPTEFIFAKAVFPNQASMPVTVDRIATMVPRRGCFLVDISPSMVRETHFLTDKTINGTTYKAAQFGFNYDVVSEQNMFNWLPSPRPGVTDPRTHYQNDYRNQTVLTDANYSQLAYPHHPAPASKYSLPVSPNFKIDQYLAANYEGPQPLRTVMKGLDEAVQIFKSRSVVGDQMCMIFFDTRLYWSRVVKLTDDFDYLDKLTSWDIRNDATRGFDLAMKHYLFPDPLSHTNTTRAVTEALSEFQLARQEYPKLPTSDFIVLIGDGLTNCYNCPNHNDPTQWNPRFDTDGNKIVNNADKAVFDVCYNAAAGCRVTNPQSGCPTGCSWADANGDGYVAQDPQDLQSFLDEYNSPYNYCSSQPCWNRFSNYYVAMSDLHQVAQEAYSQRVPIHVVFVGQDVGPHTVDHQVNVNGTNRCLTDYEKRAQGRAAVKGLRKADGTPFSCVANHAFSDPWVDPNALCDAEADAAFTSMSPTAPFYQADEDLYKVAQMTGGMWLPLRPCGGSCGTCDDTGLTQEMCQPGLERVTFDPKCRSYTKQIRDFMEEIMGLNPFTVVSK